MSDRDKEILGAVASAIPKLSEFEKGYFLGVAENASNQKKAEKTEEEKKEGE